MVIFKAAVCAPIFEHVNFAPQTPPQRFCGGKKNNKFLVSIQKEKQAESKSKAEDSRVTRLKWSSVKHLKNVEENLKVDFSLWRKSKKCILLAASVNTKPCDVELFSAGQTAVFHLLILHYWLNKLCHIERLYFCICQYFSILHQVDDLFCACVFLYCFAVWKVLNALNEVSFTLFWSF